MKRDDHIDRYIVAYLTVFLLLFVVLLLLLLSLRTQIDDLRANRAAVADVERFIYQQYPTIDAATRRGHAEILIEATTGKCAEIADNAFACPGYGITKIAPIVRQYAAQAHGLKP